MANTVLLLNDGTLLGSFNTIQAAVDSATTGNTLSISAGFYNESVFINKALVIQGVGAGQTVVIPPSGSGFTIIGNLGTDATLTIDNITFQDSPDGSGVAFDDNAILGTLAITNSEFLDNFRNGLAIGGNANLVDLDSVVINDSTFSGNGGNQAAQTSSGDGDILFFQYNGNATLQNLVITGSDDGTGPGENGIQFRGDTGALGTVLMDNITIDGVYEKQPIAFFNYDNLDGLTATNVVVTADSTSFGIAGNFDGIGGNFSSVGIDATGAPNPLALQGDNGDNVITGGSENNLLRGGGGNDTLDGGGGTDTAVLTGSFADYTISQNPDGSTTVNGPDGIDTLINIEGLLFNDGPIPNVIVGIAASDDSGAENPLDTATFTLTRSNSIGNLTVQLNLDFGIGLTEVDFALSGGSISVNGTTASVVIPDGSSTATITLTPVDDALAETAEALSLTILPDGNYIIDSNASSAFATITDNEVAALTLFLEPTSIVEGAGTATATVTRNTDSTEALEVALSSSDPSEGTVPVTVIIPAGETNITFPVTIMDDAALDGTQSTLITASASGLASGTATLTVLDNDTQTTLRIEAENIASRTGYRLEGNAVASGGQILSLVGSGGNEIGTASFQFLGPTGIYDITLGTFDESDGAAGFEVTLNGTPLGVPIVLDQNTNGSNAANVTTRTTRLVATGVSLTNGDNLVVIGNENGGEHARFDFIEFTSTNGGEANQPPTAFSDGFTTDEVSPIGGNVLSNDTGTPPLTIIEVNGSEPAGSEIILPSGALLTLNADGSFVYNPNGQFINLASGETDTDSFSYLASNIEGVSEGTVTVTINGLDETTLSLTITPASFSENGGNATATVTRNPGTSGNLTVTLSSSDPTEATVPATVVIPDGSEWVTFTITGVDDAEIDGPQSVTITAEGTGFSSSNASVTVTDDENPFGNSLYAQFGHVISHYDGNNIDKDDIAAMPMAALFINAAGFQAQSTFFYNNNLGDVSLPERVAAMRASAAFAEKLGIQTFDYEADIDQTTAKLVEILDSGQQVLAIEGGPMEAIYRALELTSPQNRQNITLLSHSDVNEVYKTITRPGISFVRTWQDIINDFPEVQLIEIVDQNPGFANFQWNWLNTTTNPIFQEVRSLMLNADERFNDTSDAGMHFFAITGNQSGNPLDAQAYFAEYLPSFGSTPSLLILEPLALAENETIVLDIEAYAPNGDTEGNGLTYTLTGGNDQGNFVINTNTGLLSFVTAPDFENPSDSNSDNVYEVEVTVTDTTNLTDTQTIHVTVNDVDETFIGPPVVVEAETITNVSGYRIENNTIASGGALLSLVGQGINEVGSATFTFSGVPGTYEVILGTFDENDGAASFTVTQNGNLVGPSVVLNQNPGGNAISLNTKVERSVATIAINSGDVFTITGVENGSEHARFDFIRFEPTAPLPQVPPTITTSSAVSLPENQAFVLDINATDANGDTEGNGLTYSLTGGADQDSFSLNPNTGELSFINAPDFEAPDDNNGDNIYEVAISVTDSNGDTANQDLTVTVTNVNEAAGIVSIAATTQAAEPNNNGLFTVNLSNSLSTDTIVSYTLGGTATAGTDYVMPNGDLTILAGQTFATIPITVLDDILVEGNEIIVATLTGVIGSIGVELGATSSATVTITDDDAPLEVITFEAENADSVVNYRIENITPASGGQVLSLVGLANGETGRATFNFGPDDLAGTYDIILGAFDENDGVASFTVELNDAETQTTTQIGSLVLDVNRGSALANAQTQFSEKVAIGISLTAGDSITVTGLENGAEHARLDFLNLVPTVVSL